MKDSFLTLSSSSEGLLKDRGSKFIAYAFPVQSIEDVENRLSDVRKEHHSARHHCYAYRLGVDGEQYRANDDGEPSGSAGKPIHGQLLSFEITNALVVVVRYFGGVKLGVGGLIQAYKGAAKEALTQGKLKEVIIYSNIRLTFAYGSMNAAMQLVNQFDLKIYSQQFDNDCLMLVGVRRSKRNEIHSKLEGQIELKWKFED